MTGDNLPTFEKENYNLYYPVWNLNKLFPLFTRL